MELSIAKEIMTLNTKEAVKFVRENLNWLNDEEQMFEEATSGNWTDGEYTDEEVDEAIQTVDDNWVREMIEELNTENKEDETMTREELNTKTVKELRAMAKELCIEGMSRAKKEELVQAILNCKDAKPAFPNTITKVNMFAFTGMFIGEFEAEVQDGKILVSTASRGELMFDLNTGKEICEESKTRWANRVEAV